MTLGGMAGWYLSPSGWPTYADSDRERDELLARGYDVLDPAQVQAKIDAFRAADAVPPSSQLPGWALAADVAAALAAKADASALAAKVNSSTYTAGLAGKADLVGGKVPDAQIPARLDDAALRAAFGLLQKVAATVTASGALVVNKHNPVDASGGAKTMTLPTGQTEGTQVSVEKTDASTNAVTITGNIRGVGSSSISLPWQNEALLLRADSTGSWWPISGHKTKASLEAAFLRAAPSYAGARTRPFDGTRDVYGSDGPTRRPIRYALGKALAGSALVPIMFLGDSATAGWKAVPGSTDPVTKLRNMLTAAGYPVTGGWIYPSNGTTSAADNRWAFTGTWQGLNTTDNSYRWTTVNGATATMTSDLPGTVVEFVVFAASAVTVNYQIDGGASVPYVLTANQLNKVQITGLADTTHSVKVTTTSTATLWVGPARVRRTVGVSISNSGIFGSKAATWLPTYNSSAFYNPYNLSVGLETAALTVMGLGGNEAVNAGSDTVAGMTTSLVTIGTAVKATGSALAMQTYLPIDDSIPAAAHPGTVWGDWLKGMYDAADSLGVVLIDHSASMGSNAALIAAGLGYTDKIHPLDAGYADIARRTFEALRV